jgi:hypothetical protein
MQRLEYQTEKELDMSNQKDPADDDRDVTGQEIGRINNELGPKEKQHEHRSQQEVGRVHNEERPVRETEVPAEQREVGVINNEKEPQDRRDDDSAEDQEIGVVNNDKED